MNWSLVEAGKLQCQEQVDEVEDALEQQLATQLNQVGWELEQENELQEQLVWAQIKFEYHLEVEFGVELVGLAIHSLLVLLHNAWDQQNVENDWVIY